MESYLKFLEDKVNKVIADISTMHTMKREVKVMQEENEVMKNLLFGTPNISSLTSEIRSSSESFKHSRKEYSTYTKACIDNDVIHKGCLMYRIEKLERNQANISDFTKDVDNVLGGFEQRITTKIKTKTKDTNSVSLHF